MNFQLQVTIAIISLIALTIFIVMIKKKQLELRYALVWLMMGVGVLIMGAFPVFIFGLSELMGIADPVNMLFFVGFCFSLAIIFTLTMSVSRMSMRIKDLAQTIALLESQNKCNEEQEERVSDSIEEIIENDEG